MNATLVTRVQRNWFLTGGLLSALVGSVVGMLMAIESQRATLELSKLAYLPKGEYLRVASLGYRELIADTIWIEVLHQYGNRHLSVEGFRWTSHAVDVLTDLDPKFVFAYQAAGTNLAVSARLIPESLAILEKGFRNNPESWALPFIMGYDYLVELHDPEHAAKYFRAASFLPGAPSFLSELATKATVAAGDPTIALEYLQRLYEQTSNDRIKAGVAERIKEVVTLLDIRFLEEGVRRYQTHYGKLPGSVHDLVAGGIIERVPEEPLGGEYVLMLPDGQVKSTRLGQRLELHLR